MDWRQTGEMPITWLLTMTKLTDAYVLQPGLDEFIFINIVFEDSLICTY